MTSDKNEVIFYSEAWYVHIDICSSWDNCLLFSFFCRKWYKTAYFAYARNVESQFVCCKVKALVCRVGTLGFDFSSLLSQWRHQEPQPLQGILLYFLLFHILPFFLSEVAQPLAWPPFLIAGVRERKPFLFYHWEALSWLCPLWGTI